MQLAVRRGVCREIRMPALLTLLLLMLLLWVVPRLNRSLPSSAFNKFIYAVSQSRVVFLSIMK